MELPKLDSQSKIKLLDSETGKLQVQGYGVGSYEESIVVNYQDGRPLSKTPGNILNNIRYRAWNYFILHTPKHVIQFIFVDVISGREGGPGICPSNVIVFDKTNPKGSMQKSEESTFTCPKFDRTSLFDFSKPAYLDGNGGKLHMSVTKKSGDDKDRIYKV